MSYEDVIERTPIFPTPGVSVGTARASTLNTAIQGGNYLMNRATTGIGLDTTSVSNHPISTVIDDETYARLAEIHSSSDLIIDTSVSLKPPILGDLKLWAESIHRCTPRNDALRHVQCVVHRYECMDKRIFNEKVLEVDTQKRLSRGEPGIVTVFSWWMEPPSNEYYFKTVCVLEQYADYEDLRKYAIEGARRPDIIEVLSYCSDILKGLMTVHAASQIHGRVKPSSILINREGHALLGDFAGYDLSQTVNAHMAYSSATMLDKIRHSMCYWAPELLRGEQPTSASDIWALGITLYELVVGIHPFCLTDENEFREDVRTVNIDWRPLIQGSSEHKFLATLIRHMVKPVPEERFSAANLLALVQIPFAAKIQRAWRRYRLRKNWKALREAVVVIQSYARTYLATKKYKTLIERRKQTAITEIIANYRGFQVRQSFTELKLSIHQCQANLRAKRQCDAFCHMREAITRANAVARGMLARKWYSKYCIKRDELLSKLERIHHDVSDYHASEREFEADTLRSQRYYHVQLSTNTTYDGGVEDLDKDDSSAIFPVELLKLRSFEEYDRYISSTPEKANDCVLVQLREADSRMKQVVGENATLRAQLAEFEREKKLRESQEEVLKQELGNKYPELQPMIDSIKANLARVERQCKRSVDLKLDLAHEYKYTRWEEQNEPNNRVENALVDDETEYRGLQPKIDVTLENGVPCFVSEVSVCPGSCGPSVVEIYTASEPNKFNHAGTYNCTRDPYQVFMLSGEQTNVIQIRFSFTSNIRGGQIVSVRKVGVKGLTVKACSTN